MRSGVKQTSLIQASTPDPLLHNLLLPLQTTFHPIGFPVRIATNDTDVIGAAEEGWSTFAERFSVPAIDVRVIVSDYDTAELPASPTYRAQRHLLAIVSDAANFAMCDLSTGFAFACLSKAAAMARAWTRHFFLDAMAYATLVHLRVTAVHAACLARNGSGVLLCAPSGMGKSVLALKCAQRGWTFITDDVAYLLREAEGRTILGKPAHLKFLPSASRLFPDIPWRISGADHAGESFVELGTAELDITTAESCRADYLVFLQRQAGATTRLLPIGSDDAFARLTAELPAFERSVHQAHLKSLHMLSHLPAVELHYADVDAAVLALDEVIRA